MCFTDNVSSLNQFEAVNLNNLHQEVPRLKQLRLQAVHVLEKYLSSVFNILVQWWYASQC